MAFSFLERRPALKRIVANQYQAILAAGAVAFSALTLSPLPLLALAGVELMAAPFLYERAKRRLEIEKKHAERQARALTQEQRYEALPPAGKAKLERLRRLIERVRLNYRALSPTSQGILGDQEAKLEAILASCLKRLWLVRAYDDMTSFFDPDETAHEVERIEAALARQDIEPRVREALEKNLQIKRQLLETVERNTANRTALVAEIDSLETLLELLLQKSVAATDAVAFAHEIDDVLAHVEADAASVEEMERMLGAMPELAGAALPARLREPQPPPPPPPPARSRERQGRR